MARPKNAGPDVAILLTAEESADLCRVDVGTWYRWYGARKCPAPIKLGGCTRWRRVELEAWAEAGCPDRATWEARRR